MKLTVLDRVLLLSSMPEKDSFDKLLIRKDILSKVEFNQEELEEFGVKTTDNQVRMEKPTEEKEIAFTESELNYVAEILKSLSDRKELTVQHMHIYDLFVAHPEVSSKK